MPTALVCFGFFGCVVLSALGVEALLASYVPAVERFTDQVLDKYDAYVPEVRIRNGKASISQAQPYFLDTAGAKDVAMVIDTNIEGIGHALKYLKGVSNGFVLTRTTVVTKNNNQINSFALVKVPDMDLNAAFLRAMKDRYFPALMPGMAFWSSSGATAYFLMAVFYYLFAKMFQVLIFALVPLLSAARCSVKLDYGVALKIATIGLIPAVVLDFIFDFAGVWATWTFMVYFVIYLGIMILSVVDMANNPEEPEPAVPSIRP